MAGSTLNLNAKIRSVSLLLLINIFISHTFAQTLRCEPEQQRLVRNKEIKCDDGGCGDCQFIQAVNTELFNCGTDLSCSNLNVEIRPRDDFLFECGGKRSCLGIPGLQRQIVIDCQGRSIKGIKCGDDDSCRYQRFFILGGIHGCNIEKIECDGKRSCEGAQFDFFGNVNVDEFVCGDSGSCRNLVCTAMTEELQDNNCPSL